MDAAAAALGVSVPVLRFVICFALTLPAGFLWRFVEGVNNRHLYSALTGAVLSYYSFGVTSNLHFAVPILLSYLSMVFYRRRCGLITFIGAFTFLISCHVIYMSGDAWKSGDIDSTGALMVLTLKVVSAAMNYQDGLLKEEGLRPAQEKYRITNLPPFITYLGYCLFCGTHMAGPVFELKDYIDWTENRGLWDPKQPRPPPSPYGAAFSSFIKALFCMVVYVYLSPRVPLSTYSDPAYYKWGFFHKVGYNMLSGFTTRWKYYFIWSLSEASVIISGFGFSGWKGDTPSWDRACNVDIPKVELPTSAAQIPAYWNIHVSTWLRHYVYERLTSKGKKPGFWQILVTQVVSAVWHGVYAGYLLFFVNSALFLDASKVIYRYQRAVPEERVFLSKLLVFVNGVFASFAINTTCIGFLVLGLRETLAVYQSTYYSATLLSLALIIFGAVVKPPRPASSVKPKKVA
ncbi:hypothetical protein R1sor_006474 [Riccia sorocarpa]|uniref:Lysophospholipid acyltransferase 1 n=1 Tax=Riccia sorocarpa TaxID=122646 RepID=A0ABD3HMI5_9MARC